MSRLTRTGIALAALASVLLFAFAPSAAVAGNSGGGLSQHPQSERYRGRPEVRGFQRRVGGYSYRIEDGLLNEYSSSRTFVDGEIRNQGLPFDNGFFFSSGVGSNPVLNRSPYPN